MCTLAAPGELAKLGQLDRHIVRPSSQEPDGSGVDRLVCQLGQSESGFQDTLYDRYDPGTVSARAIRKPRCSSACRKDAVVKRRCASAAPAHLRAPGSYPGERIASQPSFRAWQSAMSFALASGN